MKYVSTLSLMATALLILTPTVPAQAAAYNVWDFASAAECDIGGASQWEKTNEDMANFTPTWDGNTHVRLQFARPVSSGQEARMRYKFPLPNTVTFATYPSLKMRLTISGVPAGQHINLESRVRTVVNGDDSPRVQVYNDHGNGTYIVPLDMEYPYDLRDYPDWDAGDPSTTFPRGVSVWNDQGTNHDYTPETDTMLQIMFYFDLTQMPLWFENWSTQGANIRVDIDWIALTDDCTYGGQDDCTEPHEGEGEEGEGEGETNPLAIISSRNPPFIVSGMDLTLTAPAGTFHFWKLNGENVVGSSRITGNTSRVLQFDPVLEEDEGTYTCLFNDGTKEVLLTDEFHLVVLDPDVLPVAGIVGLGVLVTACAVAGAVRVRRRNR